MYVCMYGKIRIVEHCAQCAAISAVAALFFTALQYLPFKVDKAHGDFETLEYR